MRIDRCVAAVDKETKLAETAAVADEFVDVCVCFRITGALERKVCKMASLCLFDSVCQGFDSPDSS